MKINKKYAAISLVAQMVIIPIILTLGLFVILWMPGNILSFSDQGKYIIRFVYLLIGFFGSLIISTIIGFVLSTLWRKKDIDIKDKYKIALIPIGYALVFAILILVFSKEDYNSGWWLIYVLKNPIFFIFDFTILLMGFHFLIPVVEIVSYTGFILGIYLYELTYKKEVRTKVTKNLKIASMVIGLVGILVLGIETKDVISNGITEIVYGKSTLGNDLTEDDLIKIAPFKEDNGLSKLDKPASLQFTDLQTMPRLDGATAAYPVYGAFVEAVYKGLGDYYNENKASSEKDIYTAFVMSENFPFNIIKCSKTEKAYERLINGETDIIFVAEPSKSHMETIKTKGDEFVLTPIGSEAFVFFTNKKNTVENLTIKQIQDIYSGNIKNWKEVGGQNKAIQPYQRPENSGSQTVMQNKVMKNITMLAPTQETFAGGMGDIITKVASYKNAKSSIGYSFMYYSSQMFRNNQIKYLSIDGIKPTPETVRNKTYPFTVPVYAVTLKSNKNENVDKFVQWVISEEGQQLVEQTGYVPMK
ncbi:substrate-binding domain-containing protein [Clostridium sp.]|uniref:substrate-binding domain-containing protein n=1 Tax=Clostridium sp. TaxID=1506 RepID=UPI002FCA4CE9